MRFALITALSLAFLGCAGEKIPRSPTAPGPPPVATAPFPTAPVPPAPPPELTDVWVAVFPEGSAICIPLAMVEIVRGQGLGRRLTQSGCNYWDPDYDAVFDRLNVGEEITLRAFATGYAAKEIAVVPRSWEQSVTFELSRIQ